MCSHEVADVELFQCSSQKPEKRARLAKNQFYNSIPDSLSGLNAKHLTIGLAMLAYGNRRNTLKFARANNSDLLRELKQLMETKLYKGLVVCVSNWKKSFLRSIEFIYSQKQSLPEVL